MVSKKNQTNIILGITLLIAVALLIIAFLKQDKILEQNQEIQDKIHKEETQDPVAKTNFKQEQNWGQQERAQDIINKSQDKEPNTEIISTVVQDPTDNSIFYIATTEIERQQDEKTPNMIHSRIYNFNNETGNWERIYKQKTKLTRAEEGKKPETGEYLKILGYDNNKLILTSIGIDYSPGPCYSDWLSNNLKTLNLASPYNKFETYEPPKELKKLKEQKSKECTNNL